MHPSSLDAMRRFYRLYVEGTDVEARGGEVLDVGGADVNGSYRSILAGKLKYLAVDLEAGPGVDVILADPYRLPFADHRFDIVVCGQTFEHTEYFWETFDEMARVMKSHGFIVLIAPSTGPEHRYPQDCYRFYPDAYRALAKRAGLDLIEVRWEDWGPWRDIVGVFRRPGAPALERRAAPPKPAPWTAQGNAEEERVAGKRDYLDVLRLLHRVIQPGNYLEIGVGGGASLSLASCSAIGVDPFPALTGQIPDSVEVAAMLSDDFFDLRPKVPVDFAFIDGLHDFEQALRDFMNIERHAHPGTVVAISSIYPNHPRQAQRKRATRAWTGDVWKLREVLARRRPDLRLAAIDTAPAGLLLVAGLDPNNRALWEVYNPLVREWWDETQPPEHVLARTDALDPTDEGFEARLRAIISPQQAAPASSFGHAASLPLSIVVISYNMARELPRTIRSLSPLMQLGISESDYEIIVVDNGSTQPFDESQIRALASNVSVHRMQDATVSPVRAINHGLALARGRLVGVCIDGARMASPGLLARALEASRLHAKPVIGSIAFHLGPKVQMESVNEGYDQATEDRLLAESGWGENGYRLFEIAVLAGSSQGGWFTTPAETNALFLTAEHWREIGGYDEGFETPGGGLANLDVWKRVCEDPEGELIMLLGEATFHQVHGGVATNSPISKWDMFQEEYQRLRGVAYSAPTRPALQYGVLHPRAMRSVKGAMS